MALPVAATPVLEGKEVEIFWKKINNDLKKPTTYIGTPKIAEAEKLISEYVKHKNI